MATSVVIKVKYEETLRRFNVPVNGDQRLDLNMESLRLKIFLLFNLPSSADFSLTYRDEDEDLVTLVDDEDLHDVVRQGLNPVRITVSLKTDKTKTAQPSGISSGNATPRGSSSSSMQQNVNPNVAEVMKSVPEPLRDAFSKISTELTSKAASTSPLLADLLDGFSKMGHQFLNVPPSDYVTADGSNHAEGCYYSKPNAPSGKVNDSNGEVVKKNDTEIARTVKQIPKRTQVTKETEPVRSSPYPFVSLKGKNAISESSSHKLCTSKGTNKNEEVIEDSAGKSGVNACMVNDLKASLKRRASSEKETGQSNLGGNMGCPKSYLDSNSVGECPFSGGVVSTGQRRESPKLYDQFFPPQVDAMGTMFHKGVRCDGCGVLPITGPRFKSKVKHDYDLCSICYQRTGNDLEYSRIDFPLPYRHPWALRGFYDGFKGLRIPPVPVPLTTRKPTGKHHRSRLDSRFIMDVNVMDGTMMAPSTPFTKIWRMRNNGALPWYHGLQLLWIGGDRFSASDSVKIEIPIDGVNVGKEIDIAVDFIAPELPGRYISYWRMAEPSGHKFGQRVWVLVQVDASADLTHETDESPSGLNLNLPPETAGASGPEVLDMNVALNYEDLKSPSMVEQRRNVEIEDLNFPINNDLLLASDSLFSASDAASSMVMPTLGTGADVGVVPEAPPVSNSVDANPDVADKGNHESPSAPPEALYPIIDMSAPSSSSTSPAKNYDSNLEQDHEKNNVEETLLKELEEMGFKQVSLNKEVLRVNEYDFEQAVDDLCGVSEWDPMLEELKEMGFEDKETNKKLLAKNNGSITRVVMDLIAGEKPQ